jgi:hypothetical protein
LAQAVLASRPSGAVRAENLFGHGAHQGRNLMIRLVSYAAAGALAVGIAAVSASDAKAQANVLKECGAQYQAAKAANELKGKSWQDFLKACRARLAEPAAETPAAPAESAPSAAPSAAEPAPSAPPAPAAPQPAEATPPAETAPPAAAPTAKPKADTKAAQQSRQKKCGAEWKAKKAELLKANPKLTWPKFLSDCAKRLKAAGE